MMIPHSRRQALLAAIALTVSTMYPAVASQPEVVVANTLTMNSTSFVDTFDSSNPFKSTNGLYDPAKIDSDYTTSAVGILNNLNSDLHGGFVFGSLCYSTASGISPKNTSHVMGGISTPFNTSMPPAADPTWTPDATFSGGANAPKTFTAIAARPQRIKVNGDYSLPGGSTAQIAPSVADQDCYLEIWVTGKLNISGSSRMMQDPRAHVLWYVDKDITVSGDSYKNQSGLASQLSFVGVNSGKVSIAGASNLPATVQAPLRDVAVSGGGSLSGGIFGKTLTLGGNSSVHCDEALFAP